MGKLLYDLFPVILFFVAFKLQGIFVATAVAIAASLGQVGWTWARSHRVEPMHLVTLAIIVVFGGLTLWLQDRSFVMWKPTIINWLFAAAFLIVPWVNGRTIVERMMAGNIELPPLQWKRLNLAWVVFFFAVGLANIYVANRFFEADRSWRAAAGLTPDTPVEEFTCDAETREDVRGLCATAANREEQWVDFKLFGILGLTIVFVLGQGVWLSRHVKHEDEAH